MFSEAIQQTMIRLGEYLLDTEQARLTRKDNGEVVNLEPKLNDLLQMFVATPNQIISRETILDDLWERTIVTDNAINKLVGNLRKLLNDDAKNPRYIETVPKRGYRLVCSVEHIEKPNIVHSTRHQNRITRSLAVFAILVAVLLLIFFQKDAPQTGYSIALTRAEGVEITPRIHPDNQHLYYLQKRDASQDYELWVKNVETSISEQIQLTNTISEIIAVALNSDNQSTRLFYLNKTSENCAVYESSLPLPQSKKRQSISEKKLFTCDEKRIKDIGYSAKRETLYYAAQPQNFQPNHLYAFDLKNQTHQLVTQLEPAGWGHHSLDVSPDGDKLLIMSTNSDYKTQLLSLDLTTNTIAAGFKFDHPVTEAIWHHDSEHVFYFSPPPSNRIMLSDFDGSNAISIMSVTNKLSPDLSRLLDSENLLFSTDHKNYSNRWLSPSEVPNQVTNSAASDAYPALFHNQDKYLFASNRTGNMQIYSAKYDANNADLVTNLPGSHAISYVSLSADDKTVVFNLDNRVYQLAASELNETEPLQTLNDNHLVFESENPIIYLDWLSDEILSITSVENGIPKAELIRVTDKRLLPVDRTFAYALGDAAQQDNVYFVQATDNAVFKVKTSQLSKAKSPDEVKFVDTGLQLPQRFYHVKADAGNLYFVTTESGKEYLNTMPLTHPGESTQQQLKAFSSYDVTSGRVMVSEVKRRQGNVFRTVL